MSASLGRKWEAGNPEWLRKLASRIEDRQLWAGHLSEGEHAVWIKALKNENDWRDFIEGRVESTEGVKGSLSNGLAGGVVQEREGETKDQSDISTIAFRARAMLYEASIAALFPAGAVEYASELNFRTLDESKAPDERDFTKDVAVHQAARKIEEEDYDEEEAEVHVQGDIESQIMHSDIQQSSQDIDDIAPALPIKSYPFDAYYHTFEYDRAAMLEQQTLEEVDQHENEANSDASRQAAVPSVSFGAANVSLKHLLSKIEAKRESLAMSDIELRNLLSEVRRNRSKWASADFIGQEELYEACESFLKQLNAWSKNELTGMARNLFTLKVKREEARDYYDIIKHPMDFGTMGRKLAQKQYRSKQQFVDDLNLIWQNCMTYNPGLDHFTRKPAESLRTKVEEFQALCPDITIRTRDSVEREEAAEAAAMKEEEEEEAASEDDRPRARTGRKAGGFSTKGVGHKGGPKMVKETIPEETIENRIVNGVREESVPYSQDESRSSMPNGTHPSPPPAQTTNGTPSRDTEAPPGADATKDDDEDEDDDVLSKAWREQTKKIRAKYAGRRHRLFNRGRGLLEDDNNMTRTQIGMKKFNKWEQRSFAIVKFEAAVGDVDPEGDDGLTNGLDDKIEGDDFLAEYEVNVGVPELIPMQIDDETARRWFNLRDRETRKELSALDPRIQPPRGGLLSVMKENAKKLAEIRKLCVKVGIIRSMGQQNVMFQSTSKQYEVDDYAWGDDSVEGEVALVRESKSDLMDGAMGEYVMEQAVSKIFYHNGFEEFQPSALDLVTDVAVDYLKKLGSTLRLYLNDVDNDGKYDIEGIILHTLNQNGIENLEALESYVKDDIERHGTKLDECQRRMKKFLADLLRPALQEGEDGTNLFNDQNESFISGDFSNELGDDFFGFKELGLDKEFDMISLAVPMHLLHGRMRAANFDPAGGNGPIQSVHAHQEPPQWEPVTAFSLEQEIGLMKAFFYERLSKTEQGWLVEDENLPAKQKPPKPKISSNGKIMTPRKRKDQPSGTTGQSLKKKKKTGVKEKVLPPTPQLPTPSVGVIRDEDEEGQMSDNGSLFG